jgi:hypothetical protein
MAACTSSIHVFLGRPLFFSPLVSFWCGHTIVVFSSLWCTTTERKYFIYNGLFVSKIKDAYKCER